MNQLNYNHVLIRYGELYTKGKNRKEFVNRLYGNIKKALLGIDELAFLKTHDRIYVTLNGANPELVKERLKNVFGLSSFSFALKCKSDLEEIKNIALQLAQSSNAQTFKIITKRKDKSFPINSDGINREVATVILKNTEKKVNVREPQLSIHIELQNEFTYITSENITGLSGYPVGSGGKALVMMSGGIDSPVASYLTMKRGISLDCVHFASPPYTSEQSKQKVVDLVKKLTKYQPTIRLHVVDFTKLQLKIYEHTPESYAITIMRRMMYRIMDRLCEMQNLNAFVNGENVGQVASQTLTSMQVIGSVTNKVVLKPLLTYDKLEIIDIAEKIDTYKISIIPFEDCCTIFSPKQPTTKPKEEQCIRYEERFDYESLIEECINTIEMMHITQMDQENEDLF